MSGDARRYALLLALVLVEIVIVTFLHAAETHISQPFLNAYVYFRQMSLAVLLIPACFAVLTWEHRAELGVAWRHAVAGHKWTRYLVLNLAAFCALVSAILLVGVLSKPMSGPPTWTIAPYFAAVAVTGLSILAMLAPPSFLLSIWRQRKIEIAIALAYSCVVLLMSNIAQRSWEPLSNLTLVVIDPLLRLIETNVEVDFASKEVHFRYFSVHIAPQCSGYDGIGLVFAFLVMFLYAMRGSLRFPHALVLLPIGVGAIWAINIVRIVSLICLGAYVSEDVAIDGFHSQAGWLAFLFVTLAIMWLSSKSSFIAAAPARAKAVAGGRNDDPILAYLVPFMALLSANILASLAAPYSFVLYPLMPLFVGAAVWHYRASYSGLLSGVSYLSIGVGVVVGVLWVATNPGSSSSNPVSDWLGALPLAVAIGWVVLRGLGTILLVPIAEELAFRGYFHRALQSSKEWHRLPVGQASIVAFLVTAICFGLMHQRWLAGALAGAVFALLMYRSNRLSDPIAAHMAANATVFAVAVATERWDVI